MNEALGLLTSTTKNEKEKNEITNSYKKRNDKTFITNKFIHEVYELSFINSNITQNKEITNIFLEGGEKLYTQIMETYL